MTAPIPALGSAPLGELVQASPRVTQVQGTLPFAQLLLDGIDDVSAKTFEADRQASAFILDDSIPVHQVTLALEQARLSLELMVQVRSRLLEGYQQIMNMQL